MMDKEKAIEIIREEYQYGYSPTDIAQNLSEQLGAPFELVYKFVMKTLGEEAETSQSVAVEAEIPPPSPPAEAEAPIPPMAGYEPLQEEEVVETEVAAEEPAAEANQAAFFTATAPDLKALEQNPKVEKFVLQMLATNRKTSDAVLAVCERTGLSWEEAQRLVGRIAAKNHKSLKSKQNRLPMILSIVALLIGAVLAFAGINEMYTIYSAVQGMQSEQEMLLAAVTQEFVRSAFWSLAMGGILLVGGTAGLFIAMRTQFE